jgi:hypothetical protein
MPYKIMEYSIVPIPANNVFWEAPKLRTLMIVHNLFFTMLALVLCYLRVSGYNGELFQAAAHLTVAWMFGITAGLVVANTRVYGWRMSWRSGRFTFAVASLMSIVEILAFLKVIP